MTDDKITQLLEGAKHAALDMAMELPSQGNTPREVAAIMGGFAMGWLSSFYLHGREQGLTHEQVMRVIRVQFDAATASAKDFMDRQQAKAH